MDHLPQYYVEQGKRAIMRGARQRGPMLVGIGAALAAMALFVQYRSRQAERENPPRGRFVDIDGVRLHYVESGQGKPLVLLHGNGTMAKDFEISGVPGLAADKYRVITFDRPGYGYSQRPRGKAWTAAEQADLLARALQRLGIEQPIVLGHSWGTLVAVALALNHPERVRSLVLMSGYYYPTPRLDAVLLSPPAIPVIGDLMRYTVSPLIGRAIWPAMLKKIFLPSKIPERFTRLFPVWMTLRPSQLRASAMETALMIPEAATLSKRYREMRMPIVIMSGADDVHVTARRHSERLHAELPHSELLLAPGVGHMVHHVVPGQVLDAIDMAAREDASRIRDQHPASAVALH
ncbi:MAG: alpha/beta hydrolase [Noviherbaspirillum sp.]|jgi:pimeloyl-ACP methyl ester carboxylesterase|nr:alpha/beta hydrolase [Noviherbaspirillum sp.]